MSISFILDLYVFVCTVIHISVQHEVSFGYVIFIDLFDLFDRAAIGMFNIVKIAICNYNFLVNRILLVERFLYIMLFIVYIRIILSNDVQLNPGPASSFSLGHLNVRSLNIREKFEEISFLIKENNFDIFAVSETWLNEHISSECFSIPGYNQIIRLDREGRQGGGVAFFTSDSLVVKQRKDLEIPGFELLWIEFRLKRHVFLCGVGYRPPDNDRFSMSIFYNNFQITLDRIRQLPGNYNLVILGDLNSHYNINNPQDSTVAGNWLQSFLEGNNLVQMITEPTRITQQQATILDVVITIVVLVFLFILGL